MPQWTLNPQAQGYYKLYIHEKGESFEKLPPFKNRPIMNLYSTFKMSLIASSKVVFGKPPKAI